MAEVSVTDAKGKVLFRTKGMLMAGSNTLTFIQAVKLRPGIYYLRLHTGQSGFTYGSA
ncbi:MAG: T9SS type A sorting domain-containing protein [Bacteroidota bacterium]|nr:T9SS type A sorting domain-containing protein [Bacteroidota bacterium]